ncbi:hypothetical protein L596_000407 [Steinernema carpocapsae]|uniref:WAP domain-containing protein n=1 Tax=Steinernema carpocapsae TaxID=34508 RepID=A0A4U8UM92_STECR|nr:hypothetical protein L596_000407 [Steinernema carpocapsae]
MRFALNAAFAVLILAPFSVQCHYTRVCGIELTRLSTTLCTYPGMAYPCYHPFNRLNPEQDRRAFMGQYCCKRKCSKEFLTSFCCFTPDCLQSCYPEHFGFPESNMIDPFPYYY